jgi:nicrotizing toxin Mtb-like protein
VPESTYRIGEPAPQTWYLEQVDEGWQVGWFDGEFSSPMLFEEVADASAFLLGKLLLGVPAESALHDPPPTPAHQKTSHDEDEPANLADDDADDERQHTTSAHELAPDPSQHAMDTPQHAMEHSPEPSQHAMDGPQHVMDSPRGMDSSRGMDSPRGMDMPRGIDSPRGMDTPQLAMDAAQLAMNGPRAMDSPERVLDGPPQHMMDAAQHAMNGSSNRAEDEIAERPEPRHDLPPRDMQQGLAAREVQHDLSLRDSGQQDLSLRDSGQHDLSLRDSGQHDLSLRDSGQRDLSPRDSGQQDLSLRDSGQRDLPPHDLPSRDVGQRDMSPGDLQPRDLASRDLQSRDLPTRDAAASDLPSPDLPRRDVPPRDLSPRDVVPQHDLSVPPPVAEPQHHDLPEPALAANNHVNNHVQDSVAPPPMQQQQSIQSTPQGQPPTPPDWPIQPLAGEPPLTLFRGKRLLELQPGTEVDRFGSPDGNLTYVAGTPFEQRSLVPEWVNRPYHIYRVNRPVQALTGGAIPWFDQPGGGTAYLLPRAIDDLIGAGDLVEIQPAERPVS